MRPTLTINGVDCSDKINKYSYTMEYEQREGDNGGIAKDGSNILDILAYKAVITCETNGITGDDLAALLTLLQGDFLQVTFTDTRTNTDRTALMHATIGESQNAFWKGDSIVWYKSTQLMFVER